MTDFVLEQEQNYANVTRCVKKNPFLLVVDYAKFMKQTLTLGMLVPCDRDGNPYDLKEVEAWKNHDQYSRYYKEELAFFEEAKEKVLFKGVRHHDIQPSTDWNYYSLNFHTIAECSNLGKYHIVPKLHNIESLLNLSSVDKIELTESSLRQIGIVKSTSGNTGQVPPTSNEIKL